ncbi:type II toxin-antitoxin system HicA family toxin [Vibrio parahaemolyticus]|nr:type II toxin-antitoxin system HicA family toxin [Vibrio parahaemolyticus]MDN4708513.1 type II toxin-antitoxin system HicA family toxin [Vibrio parahaemolyticus]MDN4710947.1 type II toxin-antitoxin system HicA family toxin [Vibrio parahaemolyticus]MDN4716585.1 type II toxin-antitoxin system HicA family toxin [Vibrio parahaemolyticus]MDN4718926.1 type II toxin-antitoxin system HicA family toxin [Vibrio parahaemolyticus]
MKSKDLIDELLAAGCEFVRHGKGSHQIWKSPITGKNFRCLTRKAPYQ